MDGRERRHVARLDPVTAFANVERGARIGAPRAFPDVWIDQIARVFAANRAS